MKKYQVSIDYPSEFVEVEANSKKEAENKALEMLGVVEINAERCCTAEAEEIFS